MSFVGKAVKKVFKKVAKITKKVVKSKWFKIAAIVGLSLFTAGVAAGGFAAFTGVTSVGGFFSAVGSTMGTGWTALTAGLTGATVPGATTAAAGAGAAEAGVGFAGIGTTVPGVGASMMPGSVLGGALPMAGTAGLATGTSTIVTAGTQKVAQGWISKAFGTLLKPTVGGQMLRSGLAMGINGYFRGKEREREEYYLANRTVWGGKAYGGGSDPTFDWLQPKKSFQSRDENRSIAMQKSQEVGQEQGLLSSPDTLGPAPVGPAQVGPAPLAQQPQVAQQQVPTSQPPPADNQQQRDPAAPPGRINPELLGV